MERFYAQQLRKIASRIGELINGMWRPDDPTVGNEIGSAMDRYARILEPWARAVGRNMVNEIDARDKKGWREISAEMSRMRRQELTGTSVGAVTQERIAQQVELITSLPRDAAARVHKLTLEGLMQGTRASEIAVEIMRSGEVAKSRANLIARTEVSRTGTEFTQARAEAAGSVEYIWRTSHDGDVRHDHRLLEGKTFRWDSPPIADRRTGARAHPGCIYNCRCFPEPIIPDL